MAHGRVAFVADAQTGATEPFVPARRPCERFGFGYRGPFGDRVEDPNGVFTTLRPDATSPPSGGWRGPRIGPFDGD